MRFGLYAATNPRARIQHFESPFRLLRAISRLGAEGSIPVPPELMPMGARVLAQGYLNRVAMPRLSDWLLPPWMRRQSDPASPLFVPRSVSNLFLNQTSRSWTALGLPGATHRTESMVDRSGLLTAVPSGPSLDWWAEVEGSDLGIMAPGNYEVQQRLQGGMPVVVSAFEAGGLRVQSEAWLLPLEMCDWAAMQVVLFNIADLPLRGTFRFALRPYNPEGISPIYELSYYGHTLRADGRPGPFTWPRPEGWQLSDLRSGDLFARVSGPPKQGTRDMIDPRGFAHAVLEYSFNIEPWEEAEFLAFIPARDDPVSDAARSERRLFNVPDLAALPKPLPHPLAYSRAKAATMLEWRALLDGGMRVQLPHRDLQESWEANRAHLLALHDGDTITPGPDLYHTFWFRDAAYMVHALSTHGYIEAARRLLHGFLSHQKRDGTFVSQSSEWDGTGQVLWTVAQHLDMHPDPTLLEEMRGALVRAAHALATQLRHSGGLMPPGIASEHFGPPDRYYWDDFWSLAGLRAAAHLFGANWIRDAADDLQTTLEEQLARDAAVLGGALPAAPGRGIDLGAVGSLVAWYPLGIFGADSPYLPATLRAIQEKLFYEGALFVNTGHSGWGTYLNMRLAGCFGLLDPEDGWQLTRWLLAHSSPTYNWPEAIHTRSGEGSTGDGHHGWASAEWLLLVRSLLLREDKDTLHIAPGVPLAWLASHGALSVENAPTRFGLLRYNLRWTEGGRSLCLDVSGDWRKAPARLLWRLPGGSATIDLPQEGGTAEVQL